MYFKMVLLSLVYRASYLGFAYKITEISNKIEADNEISDDIEAIYKDYIKFINNIYFKEVTAQEQGIELFDMLIKHMTLKEISGTLKVISESCLIM